MGIERKDTIEGLAPIVGSAISASATGSRTIYLSGQVGTLADGTIDVFGDDMIVTASTLVGVAALFEPEWLIEIDATAVVD